MAHTQGPWEYELHDGGITVGVNLSNIPDGFSIAEVCSGDESQTIADACLIAAAPDMYEAIKEYLDWGAMTGSDRDYLAGKFNAAITKAEGSIRYK